MSAAFPTERGTNGRWLERELPVDFEQTFIRRGRAGCRDHYGARFVLLERWLAECGKARLIELRAAFVRERIDDARQLRALAGVARILRQAIPVSDKRRVSFTIARLAAHHLRVVRNGGFVVSQAPNGDWRVGTRVMSPAQMLDFAIAKGFDADLSDAGQRRVSCSR